MMMVKRLAIFLILIFLPLKIHAGPLPEDQDRPIDCLTKNIYWEAKNQSFTGQLAVALVVLNRVTNSNFPSTVCKVIYEGPRYESWKTKVLPHLVKEARQYYPRRDRCQFSWFCDGRSDVPRDSSSLSRAHRIAWLVLNGHVFDFTLGATYYHADYVNPPWSKHKLRLVQIDDHIFYKNK